MNISRIDSKAGFPRTNNLKEAAQIFAKVKNGEREIDLEFDMNRQTADSFEKSLAKRALEYRELDRKTKDLDPRSGHVEWAEGSLLSKTQSGRASFSGDTQNGVIKILRENHSTLGYATDFLEEIHFVDEGIDFYRTSRHKETGIVEVCHQHMDRTGAGESFTHIWH